jgi:hypothetical protein
MVGRYISAPVFPARTAFCFNLSAMASATIRQHTRSRPMSVGPDMLLV